MRVPTSLESLAEQGIIQAVLRPLMSGKEAQIYLVEAQNGLCAAKVYKDAQMRSFKNRADYLEGRKVRNTRDQRAIKKGSAHGRAKDEESWRTTEVDMLYRLHAAGVRVPTPHLFIEGVLLMELVTDEAGNPAPRLGDVNYSPGEATEIYQHLLQEVVRMLCAGVVHGDLSDFNVLIAADGPVVIDFPQSVNAANNQSARSLLLRDVANLHRFVGRFAPNTRRLPYGEEMWRLYENNKLTPETQLTGRHQRASHQVDTTAVLELIGDANEEQQKRQQRASGAPSSGASSVARRRVIEIEPRKSAPRGGRNVRAAASDASTNANRGGRRPKSRATSQQRAAGPNTTRAPKGRPKRGDAAQNSTYVSPAARKTTFTLTPREDPSASQAKPASSNQRRRNKESNPPQVKSDSVEALSGRTENPRKRRRSRRRKGAPTAESAAAHEKHLVTHSSRKAERPRTSESASNGSVRNSSVRTNPAGSHKAANKNSSTNGKAGSSAANDDRNRVTQSGNTSTGAASDDAPRRRRRRRPRSE